MYKIIIYLSKLSKWHYKICDMKTQYIFIALDIYISYKFEFLNSKKQYFFLRATLFFLSVEALKLRQGQLHFLKWNH